MPSVAETIDAYVAAWAETDADKRRALIERAWAADGSYVDPIADIEGRDALSEMIAGFHAQSPGSTIVKTSGIDQHHDKIRFAWAMRGADGKTMLEGIDVGEVDADGKLALIVGFWGAPPEG